MIVPGCLYNSTGRLDISSAAGIVPNYFHGGFGFMTDGTLAMDSNAPAGNFYTAGFRQSANGAIYHVSGAGTSYNAGGYRMTATDQLCTIGSAPDVFSNLDGFIAASGRLNTI